MGSDQLDLYARQVGGIANEMLEYLQPEDRNHLESLVLKPASLAKLLAYDDKVLKKACIVLGSSPSQNRKTVENLRAREPMFLLQVILSANALGALAQQSLEDERGHSGYIGWPYRKVARDLAEYHVARNTDLAKRITDKIASLLHYGGRVKAALHQFERRARRDKGHVDVRDAAKNITNVDLTAIKRALEANLAFAGEAYDAVWDRPEGEEIDKEKEAHFSRIYRNATKALEDLRILAIDLEQDHIFVDEHSMEGLEGPG